MTSMISPRRTRQKRGALLQVDFRKSSVPTSLLTPAWRSSLKTATALVSENWPDTEKLFSEVFRNNPQPISITTLSEGLYLDVNETFLSLLGYTREEVIGQTSLELGIWDKREERDELVGMLKNSGRVRNKETTLRGKEGQARVWLSSADLIEVNGELCILVVSSDITERKQVEEALRDVSARLIRAQEEERSRIARELHDGLSQKLALLCVDLEQFSQNHHNAEVRRELGVFSKRLQDASSDVHRLSHQLHPSNLDHLGLLPAVRSLCRELSERRGLTIEFISSQVPKDFENLDREVSLCAYRVIQEALTNVIKHGCASRVRVELKREAEELHFNVTDSGKGFNLEEARLKGRLGLISMNERLRLVNGNLVIRSKPMRGTQIEARIPIT